jgi:hypothetical protein
VFQEREERRLQESSGRRSLGRGTGIILEFEERELLRPHLLPLFPAKPNDLGPRYPLAIDRDEPWTHQ